MNNKLMHFASGLAIVLCLVACGSSPTIQLFRLTAANSSIAGGQQPSLGLGPVEIPQFLNRNALVYSAGNNQLHIAENELWAEPLADGIGRVVGLNLAQLLNTENLSHFPWDPRNAPLYGITISVLDLDASDKQASMIADWQIYRPADGSIITRRITTLNVPLSTQPLSAAQLPPAYSALLYQLSETIAAAIRLQESTAKELH